MILKRGRYTVLVTSLVMIATGLEAYYNYYIITIISNPGHEMHA